MGDSRAERVLGQLHHWLGSRSLPSDDGQLLQRFVQQGDEAAFAELVARHGPLVFGLCRRLLGHVQDAEDVFQATFLVLARKAATIRKPQSLSCWLHGVAYRLALKARAETERRRSHEQQIQPLGAAEDVDLSWREVRGLLDEELQRLPEKQRVPLVLCYLEGLTQDEAARRLGWPRGTLKRRLEAGRERLRLRLTRRGVTLGVGLFAAVLTDSASKGAVSVALRNATVQAGMQFVTHETAALAVTPAALLAKGALQSMLTTKLKLGAMMMLLLGCAVTAAGLAIPQATPEKQPENKAEPSTQARRAENKIRKDRYGDPLPEGAIARLGTVRLRHADTIWSVVFTRDSKTAIAGDYSGNIVYWDVATGREIRRLSEVGPQGRFPQYWLSALAISPDGKVLASAGYLPGPGPARQGLCLWDVETGKLRFRDTLKANRIYHLLFTPNGKTLVLSDSSNIIRLWDVEQRKVMHELKGHTGNIQTLSVSPDGKTLASGSWNDPFVRLWDIAGGTEKLHFVACDRDVLGVAFSPDGKTLATVGNGAPLTFFDPNTGKRLRKAEKSGGFHALHYSPDGKTLLGVVNPHVFVLDAESGKILRHIHAPGHWMNQLAFSPNGKILATFAGGPRTFDLWDVASGKLLNPIPGHRSYITSLTFSADGRQVFSASGLSDIPVQAWDVRTGERLYELDNNNPNSVMGLAVSPNGKLLAACGYNDYSLRLWDLAGRKEVRVLKGQTADESVAWSADGKSLVSSSWGEKSLRLRDAATGKERWKKDVPFNWPSDIALSPDGKSVAVGGFNDGKVRIWSVETGKELRSFPTPDQRVYSLAFSPDGSTLFTCGYSGAIHLLDAATGRLLRKWDRKSNRINHLVLKRDGRTLVTGHDDGGVRLWEVVTGKERAHFHGPRGSVRAVAISPDGRHVASGGEDTTILVWDATGGARPDAALSAEQLRTLWRDLAEADGRPAHRALWRMALSPKHALPFLVARLHPIVSLDADRQKQVHRLLADLESDEFVVRQQAEAELEKMGLVIEPALHKAMESKPSLEARQRIEKVLANLAGERLRILRALEAIEHMNTPESRRFVDSLANGAPRAWLTEEAAAMRRRWTESPRTD